MWGGGVRPGSRIREGRYGDGHEDDGDVVLGLGLGGSFSFAALHSSWEFLL